MTGLCTSSALSLLARLNNMAARAAGKDTDMNPADGFTFEAADFDVAGKQPMTTATDVTPTPVDITQSVCSQLPPSVRLANDLRAAKEAYVAYEEWLGHSDEDWAAWYGAYLAKRGWFRPVAKNEH